MADVGKEVQSAEMDETTNSGPEEAAPNSGTSTTGEDVNEGAEEKTAKPKKVTFAPSAPDLGFQGPEQMRQAFMGSMFQQLEAQVKQHEEVLDRINKQMEDERNERIKAQRTAHIPEPLKGSGQDLNDVMKTMEELITYETKDDDTKTEAKLKTLDEHGHAALVAHSISAYVSTLREDHLKKFTSKITSDCQLWLSGLFRFENASVVFHDDSRDGFVRICRLALYHKYPKYATEGFEALYSRPPVIYISAAAHPGLSSYLCLQLGLPMSCICTVPCNATYGATSKMDVQMLESLIQDDIAAAKTPVLLLAYAGTPLVGHVDNIGKLQEICKKNSIWLHVEGNNLATLTLMTVPTSVQSAKSGDSMTVMLGKWLGVPGLPFATLFKASDPSLVHAAGLNTFNPHLKLNCLPLWICLQSMGHDGILERVEESLNMAKELLNKLDDFKTIKQISREKSKDNQSKKISSVGDLISRALSALLIFEVVTPTVVFKYVEDRSEEQKMRIAPYAVGTHITADVEEEKEEEKKRSDYFDALNTWLADTLQSENPKMEIQCVNVEKEGVCIRFCPLESAHYLETKLEDIDKFVECLQRQLSILDATVLNQEQFRMIIDEHENLKMIQISNWAGLGTVQYIPDNWVDKLDNLTPKGIQEINTLNIELVHKLKATDTAFSLGYTEGEMACVKFGLITDETCVDDLVEMVFNTGKAVEESSKYLESMSEMIRRGIEEASRDLQKENQEKLIKEGVLRQVPVVGSLLNWWSPPPKDSMKGRTFNLASGKIVSTEETYKYHMQVQEGTPPPSPRSPGEGQKVILPEVKTKTAGDVKAELQYSTANGPSSPGTSSPGPSSPGPKEGVPLANEVTVEDSLHHNEQ